MLVQILSCNLFGGKLRRCRLIVASLIQHPPTHYLGNQVLMGIHTLIKCFRCALWLSRCRSGDAGLAAEGTNTLTQTCLSGEAWSDRRVTFWWIWFLFLSRLRLDGEGFGKEEEAGERHRQKVVCLISSARSGNRAKNKSSVHQEHRWREFGRNRSVWTCFYWSLISQDVKSQASIQSNVQIQGFKKKYQSVNPSEKKFL